MNAAARQQRDCIFPEEPARAFGRITGVGVIRQHDDECPPELLVKRREQQRQRRLRHARGYWT